MDETKHTPLRLVVTQTSVTGHSEVGRPDDSVCPPDMSWDDYYVGFSGYFGSHGPNVFAAAPELLRALDELVDALNSDYVPQKDGNLLKDARAAIAKAEGRA